MAAHPSVTFQFDVGGVNPGIMPRKLVEQDEDGKRADERKYRFARFGPIKHQAAADPHLEERVQRELRLGQDGLVSADERRLDGHRQGPNEQHHREARDERLDSVCIYRLMPAKAWPKIPALCPKWPGNIKDM